MINEKENVLLLDQDQSGRELLQADRYIVMSIRVFNKHMRKISLYAQNEIYGHCDQELCFFRGSTMRESLKNLIKTKELIIKYKNEILPDLLTNIIAITYFDFNSILELIDNSLVSIELLRKDKNLPKAIKKIKEVYSITKNFKDVDNIFTRFVSDEDRVNYIKQNTGSRLLPKEQELYDDIKELIEQIGEQISEHVNESNANSNVIDVFLFVKRLLEVDLKLLKSDSNYFYYITFGYDNRPIEKATDLNGLKDFVKRVSEELEQVKDQLKDTVYNIETDLVRPFSDFSKLMLKYKIPQSDFNQYSYFFHVFFDFFQLNKQIFSIEVLKIAAKISLIGGTNIEIASFMFLLNELIKENKNPDVIILSKIFGRFCDPVFKLEANDFIKLYKFLKHNEKLVEGKIISFKEDRGPISIQNECVFIDLNKIIPLLTNPELSVFFKLISDYKFISYLSLREAADNPISFNGSISDFLKQIKLNSQEDVFSDALRKIDSARQQFPDQRERQVYMSRFQDQGALGVMILNFKLRNDLIKILKEASEQDKESIKNVIGNKVFISLCECASRLAIANVDFLKKLINNCLTNPLYINFCLQDDFEFDDFLYNKVVEFKIKPDEIVTQIGNKIDELRNLIHNNTEDNDTILRWILPNYPFFKAYDIRNAADKKILELLFSSDLLDKNGINSEKISEIEAKSQKADKYVKQSQKQDIKSFLSSIVSKTKFRHSNILEVLTLVSFVSSLDEYEQYYQQAEQTRKKPELFKLNYEMGNGLRFRVLKDLDFAHFTVGAATDCCQRLGGAGEEAAVDSFVNPLAGVLVLEKPGEAIIAQSYFHYVPRDNGFILDNVETNDKVINKYRINLDQLYFSLGKQLEKDMKIKYFLCGKGYNKLNEVSFQTTDLKKEDPREFAVHDPYSDFDEHNALNILSGRFKQVSLKPFADIEVTKVALKQQRDFIHVLAYAIFEGPAKERKSIKMYKSAKKLVKMASIYNKLVFLSI